MGSITCTPPCSTNTPIVLALAPCACPGPVVEPVVEEGTP